MGIIDSLSAGYRLIGRRIELLLLPILLDIFLRFAPRLSVAPLFQRVASFYAGLAEQVDPESAAFLGQIAEMLAAWGQYSNLFNGLVNGSLFHVPSLMVAVPELQTESIPISSLGVAGGLVVVLGLVGMLIGVIYMNFLARALPLGEGEKNPSLGSLVRMVLRHWFRAVIFVLVVAVALLLLYIPGALAAGLLGLIHPLAGNLVGLLLSGLTLALFLYLYFVPVAIVLDDLPLRTALWRSMTLVRHNLGATLAFVLLTTLISWGLGLLLRNLALANAAGIWLAIPLYAFIGTGLAMALLVFYRTRLLLMAQEVRSQQGGRPGMGA